MENCCLRCRLLYKQCWGVCVGLAIGVVLVALVAALVSAQGPPGGSEGLEELQVKVAKLGQALAATDRSLAEVLAVTNRSLAQALAVTNRSLAETQGQWESCRKELDTVKSSVSELTRRLAQLQHHGDEQEANVGRLQEDNREIKEKLEQQQQQLEEAQKDRRDLQSQIWDALARIGSGQSWHSSGTSAMFPGVAVPLVLLALLLVGTLLR